MHSFDNCSSNLSPFPETIFLLLVVTFGFPLLVISVSCNITSKYIVPNLRGEYVVHV